MEPSDSSPLSKPKEFMLEEQETVPNIEMKF